MLKKAILATGIILPMSAHALEVTEQVVTGNWSNGPLNTNQVILSGIASLNDQAQEK
ncbi:hypothetical protein [Pseudoalteromonas piscicida]